MLLNSAVNTRFTVNYRAEDVEWVLGAAGRELSGTLNSSVNATSVIISRQDANTIRLKISSSTIASVFDDTTDTLTIYGI